MLCLAWVAAAVAMGSDGGAASRQATGLGEKDQATGVGALLPNGALVQIGGYTGLVAVGASWNTRRDHRLMLALGYLPKQIGGVSIWQISTRFDIYPLDSRAIGRDQLEIRWLPLLVGLGLTYGMHDALWVRVPERYNDPSYYAPTALHALVTVGTSVQRAQSRLTLGYTLYDLELRALVTGNGLLREMGPPLGLSAVGSLSVEGQVQW